MKGLKIRGKWMDLILSHEKTWEIRSGDTKERGKILLIRTKGGGDSSCIVGEATLYDSKQISIDSLAEYEDLHKICDISIVKYKRPHAWILKDVVKYKEPIRSFHNPKGSVIWVSNPLGDAHAT